MSTSSAAIFGTGRVCILSTLGAPGLSSAMAFIVAGMSGAMAMAVSAVKQASASIDTGLRGELDIVESLRKRGGSLLLLGGAQGPLSHGSSKFRRAGAVFGAGGASPIQLPPQFWAVPA